jgi:hypothetical protein
MSLQRRYPRDDGIDRIALSANPRESADKTTTMDVPMRDLA